MSRLTQLGVFCVVLGGVVLFLGLFPGAVGLNTTAGIGTTQIVAMLTGLFLVVLGAYVVVYATMHRGQERTLAHMIGIRLGLTGLVFSSAAAFADIMGFGSHISGEGTLFGWLQGVGMLAGFLISALGVLIYGITRTSN